MGFFRVLTVAASALALVSARGFPVPTKHHALMAGASESETEVPECTDTTLAILTNLAQDAKFQKVCGAANAAAIKNLNFWHLDTCVNAKCWKLVNHVVTTNLKPLMCAYDGTYLVHFLQSRLKACVAMGATGIVPSCSKRTDHELAAFATAIHLDEVCGSEITAQFTTTGLQDIDACGNDACLDALRFLANVLPICLVNDSVLEYSLTSALATCATECTANDLAELEVIAAVPDVVTYCGDSVVAALTAHAVGDIDPCVTPECEAIMFFAGQENYFPLCKLNGDLVRNSLAETWNECVTKGDGDAL